MTVSTKNSASLDAPQGAVQIYCFGSMMAEEARQAGCDGFARDVETALEGLIAGLPKAQQREALWLSYELALAVATGRPVQPHLRLVYSRD